MEAARSDPERRPSGLERFLRLFTEVHAGEGGTVLLLTANVFLILTAYYFIKPVREALILVEGGAEVKSYASAGQAILLLGAVPLYAALASRVPRRRLINLVTLFFVACLAGFYLLSLTPVPISVIFFLWVGVFNLMIVAQFWAFANDVYTKDEGERLFPIVAFGASFGAVFGAFIAARLIEPLGVAQLMLVAGGLLGLSLLITNLVDRREGVAPAPAPASDGPPAEPKASRSLGKGGAFQLVWRSRYLLGIAFLLLLLNWVNTTGEYILGRTVERAAEAAVSTGTAGGLSEGQFIGKFYADFFSVVNLLGLVIQLFVVSRILKYFGVRVALLILPVIALGGYALLAFYPVLGIVRWAKTAENATDYSLQNTVRNVLFLPTTREEKYKAKQAIDSFFVRAGDVLSAGLVFVGTTWLAFQTTHFAVVNLGLVAIWGTLALWIGLRYRRMTRNRGAEGA